MNVYIWSYLSKVTKRWHDNGGLVVIAESVDDAIEFTKHAFPEVVIDDQPCRVIKCGDDEVKQVFVFPDAGCC